MTVTEKIIGTETAMGRLRVDTRELTNSRSGWPGFRYRSMGGPARQRELHPSEDIAGSLLRYRVLCQKERRLMLVAHTMSGCVQAQDEYSVRVASGDLTMADLLR